MAGEGHYQKRCSKMTLHGNIFGSRTVSAELRVVKSTSRSRSSPQKWSTRRMCLSLASLQSSLRSQNSIGNHSNSYSFWSIPAVDVTVEEVQNKFSSSLWSKSFFEGFRFWPLMLECWDGTEGAGAHLFHSIIISYREVPSDQVSLTCNYAWSLHICEIWHRLD